MTEAPDNQTSQAVADLSNLQEQRSHVRCLRDHGPAHITLITRRFAMGMGDAGGTDKAVSAINVTPLIDVLLVLLIIFMVIVPVTPKGLDALVPQPPKNKSAEPDNSRTIVVL